MQNPDHILQSLEPNELRAQSSYPTLKYLMCDVIAPVLFSYVWWILEDAKKNNIKCLYFLARDGYMLKAVAERLVKSLGWNIELRYLYGSRIAFQIPASHLLGDEGIEFFLRKNSQQTASSILERFITDPTLRNNLLLRGGIMDAEAILGETQRDAFCDFLRGDAECQSALREKSQEAYPVTIAYLVQEDVFNWDDIGVVESGWACSVQYALQLLIGSKSKQPRVKGYYFGVSEIYQGAEHLDYAAMYFSPGKGASRKATINRMVFEMICSAPMPMTVGFLCTANGIEPQFNHEEQESETFEIVLEQEVLLKEAVDLLLSRVDLRTFDSEALIQLCQKLIVRLMQKPNRNEVELFNRLFFCDDMRGGYSCALAPRPSDEWIKQRMLLPRLCRRLFGHPVTPPSQDVLWPQGARVFCTPYQRLDLALADGLGKFLGFAHDLTHTIRGGIET